MREKQTQNILIIEDGNIRKWICLWCNGIAIEAGGHDHTDGYLVDNTFLSGNDNVKEIRHEDCQNVLYTVVEE